MNALAKVGGSQSAEQSLRTHCDNKRLKLLQAFARIEIALADTCHGTFGQMLKAWIQKNPERKTLAGLTDARNLVAHAYVEIVDVEGGKVAVWRMAHDKSMLNARVMTRPELDRWFKTIQADQKLILAALA